jgi:hypothetical protein
MTFAATMIFITDHLARNSHSVGFTAGPAAAGLPASDRSRVLAVVRAHCAWALGWGEYGCRWSQADRDMMFQRFRRLR